MSAPLLPKYIDGYFSVPRPLSVSAKTYPFDMNGDLTCYEYFREFRVLADAYTRTALDTVDPDLAGFYLWMESPLDAGEDCTATFKRYYVNKPANQSRRTTISYVKPAFPTQDFAGYWADSTSATDPVNIWSIAIAATVSRFASGGTFTVTYKANTTGALAYNAADATIAAAINALASVIADSFTVTATNAIGSAGTLTVQDASGAFTPDMADFSINTGSITPTCVSGTVSSGIGIKTFGVLRALFNFNKAAHGLSVAQAIRLNTATAGGGTVAAVATVVDANNFTVANAAFSSSAWTYYRSLVRSYTPGQARPLGRIVSSFYRPGDTITVPPPAIDTVTFLTAVCANAGGYINYDSSKLEKWKGRFEVLEQIEMDMSSV